MTRRGIDHTLETLLELNGEVVVQPNGAWIRIKAHRVVASQGRPHGVKYNLTFHLPLGDRILSYDNAHSVSEHRRIEWDHKHRKEKILPYKYVDAATLLADFFADVGRWLEEAHEDD